jgi:hypothetical protein
MDQYPPIDGSVFGSVKATARSEALKHIRASPEKRISSEKAGVIRISEVSLREEDVTVT